VRQDDVTDKFAAGGAALHSGTGAIRAAFIPLVDSAPLIVAKQKGFAAAEGLVLDLQRQTSWAALRDRLLFGHVDVAHMLGPMPIAATLGVGGPTVPMAVPMALGQGGNAITVSVDLWARMADHGARLGDGPAALGAALKAVVAARTEPLTFAIVHPFSSHNYELRYWLAAAGIHPDRDMRLVVVPPPYMVEAIESGQIDGFAVGEPWNSLAVDSGAGILILAMTEIWRSGPCKVLGSRRDWAEANPARLAALVRAVVRAAAWADDPANIDELAALLADPTAVGVDAAVIKRALSGHILRQRGLPPVDMPGFLTFHGHAATFPWHSQALWLASQMIRWGQVEDGRQVLDSASATYRPDIYRSALDGSDTPMPSASSKVEGALAATVAVGASSGRLSLGPDGFFDGRVFDPEAVDAYLAGFEIDQRSA